MRKKGIGVGDDGMRWENSLIDYSEILNESIGSIELFDGLDRCVIWGVGRPEKTPS